MAHFDQPEVLLRKSRMERHRWWQECKQLPIDALVCLVNSNGHSLFFSVAERGGITDEPEEDPDSETKAPENAAFPKYNLWDNAQKATVTLRFIDHESQDFATVLGKRPDYKTNQVLVEFPGVLLPSFQPTLEALQRMSSQGNVPFSDILVSNSAAHGADPPIHWPRYAMQPGFSFDLSSITTDGHPLRLSRSGTFDMAELLKHSTLDESQGRALIGSLSRNLAFMQGPPGTGKSYIAVQAMKVLLKIRVQAKIRPYYLRVSCSAVLKILADLAFRCYTNHALDQFLEHLIKDGTEKLIRIGSRSKSPLVERFNLREVAKEMPRTKAENHNAWSILKALEGRGQAIADLLKRLRNAASQHVVLEHLRKTNPRHHQQLTTLEDAEGFRTVQGRGTDNLTKWLHGDSSSAASARLSVKQLMQTPLLQLPKQDRRRLHGIWINQISGHITEELGNSAPPIRRIRA